MNVIFYSISGADVKKNHFSVKKKEQTADNRQQRRTQSRYIGAKTT
jgi:hypothetical protein